MAKLSAALLRTVKPKNKPYKLTDGYGLHLHVATSGTCTWRYRFKIAGKESTFVLGEYPQMSLADARTARVLAREDVKRGINPGRKRKEEKQALIDQQQAKENSFQSIAEEWIEKQRERWTGNHATSVYRSLVKNIFPYIGDQPVEEVTPPMLVKVMERMENRDALEGARKVLQRVNGVFMYAIRTGRATYNPAASLKGALKTRKVQHHAALTKEEMPQFLSDLAKARIHITTLLGLRFLILTGARTREVREAVWSEIDMGGKLWRIPAARMKMGTDHKVPLSKQSLEILDQAGDMFGRSGYLFPAIRNYNKPMSQNTMIQAIHKMGYGKKTTVHGFRSTFSTIANESGFDGDVIEKAIAHMERNRVRAAYHRSEYIEQRRELMQWWAELLQKMECDYAGFTDV